MLTSRMTSAFASRIELHSIDLALPLAEIYEGETLGDR